MSLMPEEIVPAIRSGECRKVNVPGFDNVSYFADQAGNIYSLRNPSEPNHVRPKLGKGLLWVTLYGREGYIRKLMVGDVIANTFMADENRESSQTTVVYLDGDTHNNAVDNLRWGTEDEQKDQIRDVTIRASTEREEFATDKTPRKDAFIDALTGLEESDPEEQTAKADDPLLDQLRVMQRQLDRHRKRESKLLDALRPFAEFQMSPAHAVNVGHATILEANRGQKGHSALTVQDFRYAKRVYNIELEEE